MEKKRKEIFFFFWLKGKFIFIYIKAHSQFTKS